MIQIYDAFTDPDATDLNAHIPDTDRQGGGYTEVAGDWEIASNKAGTTAVLNARAVIDAGIYDGRFKVDLMVGVIAGAAYLIFRSNAGGTNFWMAGLDDAGQVYLYSAAAMALTLRAAKAFVQDEATTYEVKVIVDGDNIEVYVDDVLMISHTSALYNTQTVAGLYATANASARFDDLVADDRPTCLYCASGDIKARMGVQWTSGTALDAVLDELINSASRLIDNEQFWPHCHFAAADLADQTRYFDTVAGTEMWIPRCISITSLMLDTNGDGVLDTTWTQGIDFEVWPYDLPSFSKIIVKEGASVVFPTGQRRLQIVGKFGGYSVPPQKIKEACVITVARWAKRAQQMYQDTGAIVELGQLTYTKALDPDVQEILRITERRVVLG